MTARVNNSCGTMNSQKISVKELEHYIINKSKTRKNVKLTTNILLNYDFKNLIEEHDYNEYIRKYEKLFNRNNHKIKKTKNKLFFTALRDCVITNDIKYPITKLNNMLDYLFYSHKSLVNKLLNIKDISTQYITDRKSVVGSFDCDGFNVVKNEDDILNSGNKIKLHPFQITHYPNGKEVKKIEYTVKSKIDMDVDYLYFIDKQIIFRIKPIIKMILDNDLLEHKDFLLNCWEKQTENCVVYYHIELIDRDENTTFKLNNTVNNKHSINEYIYPNILSFFPKEQLHPTTKLEKILNTEKLTEEETDNLFNPKVSTEPKEPQKSLINDNSSSDGDSDGDGSDDDGDSVKVDLFNLQFSYNMYYNFNDEYELIEQSIKSLYETNEKFKKLLTDFDTIRILKPISKAYTNQRYFNFILTTKDKTIFSPQYHSYLNDTNEITSLTKIHNILA